MFKLSVLFLIIIYCWSLINFSNAASVNKNKEVLSAEAKIWRNYGLKHLKKIIGNDDKLKKSPKAKNIIFFLGDGMGMTTITAGRIYKGQQKGKSGEEESLVFDEFPNTGLAKTYNIDKQVPDSAGTATALFTGIKTNYGVIGMDQTTTQFNSNQGKLTSFMKWAQDAGKLTGIVTTTRITHATPSATYANVYHRDWECDTAIPLESKDVYIDIGRQLVENEPGKNFNIIFGGGLKPMGNMNTNEQTTIKFNGSTEEVCSRGDNRNLVQDWLGLDGKRTFVQNRDELMALDINNQSHVLGLFRNNHITYSIGKQDGEPSLAEMTQQAIKILQANSIDNQGFVLLVEGGRIDQAHHQNYAHAALQEVVEFDLAIETAKNMTSEKDTLIIVTADHSHSLTFNGYPKRGTSILGFASKSNVFPYETLTYANGPGFYDHRVNGTATEHNSRYGTWIKVEELTPEIRASPTYRNLAAFPLKDESHGGEDVAVFANGPGSYLVRGVFEQNYLAYVMSYAGCMGPAQSIDNSCERWRRSKSFGIKFTSSNLMISLMCLILVLINTLSSVAH